ncbi:MAG: bifunctional 3-demethylubiquinone-9 3-methyltransferase/2-octaprenyl-6-hydroxy phenol methylase [Rhodocyclales bacterium]|nr:bifunctional 3-demethylubiquinone-9 3-methyltransferase/2-octaprenyl-6-hydroxy phenol methylase [Rhodocyclales bacterium]
MLLAQHAPGAYARLQKLRRTSDPSRTLSTVWESRAEGSNAPSDLHPVLADANLLMLERPEGFDVEFIRRNKTPGDEALEHVVDLNQMRQSAVSVCFIVPIQRRDTAALERTVQSVLRQTDPDWELLLCSDEDSADELGRWLEIDWRVRRFTSPKPLDEARFLKQAAIQATTSFIGLLSQGDVADDDLVKSLGEKLRAAPTADIIYTDEANRMADDHVGLPFYKPDWSPEHQQSVNMLGRFVAIRKSLLLATPALSGIQSEATEYGLNLALTSMARRIIHIDEPLYIRAATSLSAPVGGFFSALGLGEARDMLEAHVRVEALDASVVARPGAGSLHVRWPMPVDMPITLLILTGMQRRELPGQGEVVLATHFVRSIIEKSSAVHYKIIVVDDGTVDVELKTLLEQHGHTARTCPKSEPFSFAHKANFATSLVDSGIVLLLNDDLEVDSADWIQELAGQAARPGVGAVGCRLLFGDGTLQHAGIGLGFNGSAGHMFHHAPADGGEYAGFASIERNYSAVTGAVMAYRKEVFDLVGGFDEQFRTDYNDLDFCLKCIAKGLRVVYTGAATLYHFHNSSIKRTHDSSPERQAFLTRWSRVVKRDPYFSKNFQAQSDELPLVSA